MRKNLFEFLYGEKGGPELSGSALGEHVVRLFEEADSAEEDALKADKKPLADALRGLGVTGSIETTVGWAEITFEDGDAYREACAKVFDVDGLHTLAVAGWVPARCGDQAMANEPAEYKLGFIEIAVAETGDSDTPPNAEKIRGDAQKREASAPESDSDLNPVEHPDDDMGTDKQPGIGKTKDGSDPEGKVKGASRNESRARELVDRLLEMTSVVDIPTLEAPVPAKPAKKAKGDKKFRFNGRRKA